MPIPQEKPSGNLQGCLIKWQAMTKRKFPYFPYNYLIRAKIRENTYHFTNEQAGMPVKWGKSTRYFGKLEFVENTDL